MPCRNRCRLLERNFFCYLLFAQFRGTPVCHLKQRTPQNGGTLSYGRQCNGAGQGKQPKCRTDGGHDLAKRCFASKGNARGSSTHGQSRQQEQQVWR